MTLPHSTRRADATGNGATSTYSFGFKIFDDDDLEVIVANASGVEYPPLTKLTDYTVSGVEGASGGTISLVNSGQAWLTAGGKLKSGYAIAILGARTFLQEDRVRDQGEYYGSTHEDAWDKITVLLQQLNERVSRALTFKKTSTATQLEILDSISGGAGKALIVNDDEDGFELSSITIDSIATYAAAAAASASSAASSSATAQTAATSAASSSTDAEASATAAAASAASVGTEIQEVPSGVMNGSNTAFTLAHTPVSAASVKLYLDGIFLRQGTDYTISGANIVMIVAPESNQLFDAVYRY